MRRNTMLLSALARAMNAGGCAIVSVFDSGLGAYNRAVSAILPDKKTQPGSNIKESEKKSQALFVETAKEASQDHVNAAALESESVSASLNTIKELNAEIVRKKQGLTEIDAVKAENRAS